MEECAFDAFLSHDWGPDGLNHARVRRVHRSLARLHVTSWLDENEMKGSLQMSMASGIHQSAGVLVFMTHQYHAKVTGTNKSDNCKLEFSMAMNDRLGNVLVVVMEDGMRNTRDWGLEFRPIAMNLYVRLSNIDQLDDSQLDSTLHTDLLPQMTWMRTNAEAGDQAIHGALASKSATATDEPQTPADRTDWLALQNSYRTMERDVRACKRHAEQLRSGPLSCAGKAELDSHLDGIHGCQQSLEDGLTQHLRQKTTPTRAQLTHLQAMADQCACALTDLQACVARVSEQEGAPADDSYVQPALLTTTKDRLSTEGRHRLLLHGPPGQGKSALLRRVCDAWFESSNLKRVFPDGVILLEVGRGPEEDELQEAFMVGKLSELEAKLAGRGGGPSSAHSHSAEQLPHVLRRVRGLLADGSERLILLDDIWSAQECLLQKGGLFSHRFKGGFVVATRDSGLVEAVEGGCELMPMRVEDDECEAILATNAYNNPQQRVLHHEHKAVGKQLLAKCGQNPLMVRLMASMVKKQTQNDDPRSATTAWTQVHDNLTELLRKTRHLSDYSRPLVAYELSVRELDAEGKRLLAMLSLFPPARMLPAGAALAVWVAMTGSKAGFVAEMQALEQMSVIEVIPQDHPSGTYSIRMHALLHLYLQRSEDKALAPPPLESITPPSSSAECTAKAAATSALLLYQDEHSTTAFAHQQLQRLVPAETQESPWWRHCGLVRSDPRAATADSDDVAHGLQLAHERNRAEDVVALQQLLLSAATHRAWPALQLLAARLLNHPDTAGAAMAFIAGSHPAFSRDTWLPAYSAALGALLPRCTEDVASLKALRAVGDVLCTIGRHEESLQVLEQVLEGQRRVLDAEHGDTLETMQHVASVLSVLERKEEAVTICVSVVETCVSTLGELHPTTLSAMCELGCAYCHLEQSEQALTWAQRSLTGLQARFGDKHPETLAAMHWVGDALVDLDRLQEALATLQPALDLCEDALGLEHVTTLGTMSNLSFALREMNRPHEALAMSERALAAATALFGDHNRETLLALGELARTHSHLGDHEKAMEAHERVLAGETELMGDTHEWTLISLHAVGCELMYLDRLDEALTTLQEAHAKREVALGQRHASTLVSLYEVGGVLHRCGRYEEALEVHRRVLAGEQETLGPHHPDTHMTISRVAEDLRSLGRHEEALEVERGPGVVSLG